MKGYTHDAHIFALFPRPKDRDVVVLLPNEDLRKIVDRSDSCDMKLNLSKLKTTYCGVLVQAPTLIYPPQ